MRIIVKLMKCANSYSVADREQTFTWFGGHGFAGVREALGGSPVRFFWAKLNGDGLELEEEAPWQNW